MKTLKNKICDVYNVCINNRDKDRSFNQNHFVTFGYLSEMNFYTKCDLNDFLLFWLSYENAKTL